MCKKMIEFFIALMHNLCLKGKIIDQNQEKIFEGRGPGAGGPGPGMWAGGRGPGNSNRHIFHSHKINHVNKTFL